MQLFYNPTINETQTSFVFDKEESKHIIKVLRKKESDILHVTNGLGFLFTTEITIASDNKCTVKIVSFEKQQASKFRLHLAVAPTKMNERYEWFLEKATEIGIQEITPIICEHSERKVIKIDRFQKILESAMKQSLHYYLPKLNDPISFKDFVKTQNSGQLFIAHCEETAKKSLKNELKPNEDVTILIGPEGDFSVKEIQQAIAANFIPVSLGTTRLRTETAAIVACHSVVFKNEA
ncbi:16S rRNA (uracil(1498)-N(3))-methyltransferase [Flavobacterium sangjuense]|uniref:Ribosomal RNA small subunit methyltransferase E n=1 Tax=Flavobacterium sangjuense TaxID=2518177 RepID=A0A4P7PWB4_9FLAO|nr:16S rRNA (uracil(1498)-N(3))-methyltransferase [Flavobacterium sangjuense]QBZ98243.1 Ribosomal RNA small subunit methyltransferase E [Flavobacterium sangjuense]